jgi:hypothetical protein
MGSILAIVASTAATVIPVEYPLAARLCAAAATLIIAVSRTAEFGNRWVWHLSLAGSYDALLMRLDTRDLLPEDQRDAEVVSIREDLADVLRRESEIPGTKFVEQ